MTKDEAIKQFSETCGQAFRDYLVNVGSSASFLTEDRLLNGLVTMFEEAACNAAADILIDTRKAVERAKVQYEEYAGLTPAE